MQLQVAKRQSETLIQQLKDSMLMSGQAHQFSEIMKRIEESKARHEQAVRELKAAQAKRRKAVKEFATYTLIAFVTWCIVMVAIYALVKF